MRASPKNPFDWKFLKVGSVIVYSFVRNIPKIQECWLVPVSLRGQTTNGVYEVSYNRYGQIIERVCNLVQINLKISGIQGKIGLKMFSGFFRNGFIILFLPRPYSCELVKFYSIQRGGRKNFCIICFSAVNIQKFVPPINVGIYYTL